MAGIHLQTLIILTIALWHGLCASVTVTLPSWRRYTPLRGVWQVKTHAAVRRVRE